MLKCSEGTEMIEPNISGPKPPAAVQPLNVLVIDDNPADRELASIYLGKAWPFDSEMAIETAVDGLEALEKMRAKKFCLIMLDWRLPRGGSGHVLREMRHNGVVIPVVVMTGLGRDQLPADLEKTGAAYLNKDTLNASTLYCAIAEALRNCRLLHQPPPQPVCPAGPALFHSHSPQAVGG